MRCAQSRPITARRTAGKLGQGGGPGRRDTIFSPLRPAMLGQAQVLHTGVGDARRQRVPMQPRPGTPLEVAQTEFLLSLLVGLFAHPTGLDRAHQRAPRRPGRQVAQVVFTLAAGAPLAEIAPECPGQGLPLGKCEAYDRVDDQSFRSG